MSGLPDVLRAVGLATGGELLPCPFCGAGACVTSDPEPWPGAGRYNFKAGCGQCDVFISAETVDDDAASIAAWNRRADEPKEWLAVMAEARAEIAALADYIRLECSGTDDEGCASWDEDEDEANHARLTALIERIDALGVQP